MTSRENDLLSLEKLSNALMFFLSLITVRVSLFLLYVTLE